MHSALDKNDAADFDYLAQENLPGDIFCGVEGLYWVGWLFTAI